MKSYVSVSSNYFPALLSSHLLQFADTVLRRSREQQTFALPPSHLMTAQAGKPSLMVERTSGGKGSISAGG